MTDQQGIPFTVAALLAVDMDLTQQTRGRLLAALPFNNRYPSPSSSSPSISSVVRVCGFPLFVCSLLAFHLCSPFLFPHIFFLSSLTHFRLPYLIFCRFSSFWTFFSSPLAAWAFIPYSISSFSASSFHLSITTSAGPIHRKRFYKAKYLLLETVALKRTDLFIHSFIYSLFPKFNRKESRTSYFLWLLQTCTDIKT